MMASTNDLLIELGTEELPPKALKKLSDAFHQHFTDGLKQHELSFESSEAFATPRRLAIRIHALETQQQDKVVERKGPALQAAYDKEGNPSKAAQGFARSCGVEVEELEKLETEKGSWLVYKATQPGKAAVAIIPELIDQALNKLPIPKRMTWGAKKHAFVRPAHWLVVLLGETVVPCSVLGLQASNVSRGHRFHSPVEFSIPHPAEYEALLQQHFVIANYAQRQAQIKQGVEAIAKQTQGAASINSDLLDEVTGLVEWPVPLLGNFDKEFLEVPQEALISAMQEHQKYFPVLDNAGKIQPHFITVSNIQSKAPEEVVSGNERVIRPRLSDARFFFNTDKKKSLEQHNEPLKKVVFEKELGTVYEKSTRVAQLAKYIAEQTGGNATHAERAGILSKADLSTEMVGEFPDLQGIMGTYYGLHSGEATEVAQALNDQYQPRFAGDQLPESTTGAAVALADKIDTLVGILGIGKHPTGDKDPYALRRAALGVLRIIIGKQLHLDLVLLLDQSTALYGNRLTNTNIQQDFLDFLQGRYQAWFNEEGISTDIIKSVLSVNATAPLDFYQRVKAVQSFKALPEAEALAAANKRVSNILAKSEGGTTDFSIDTALFVEAAEQALFDALEQVESSIEEGSDYSTRLKQLAQLREPVDAFFDSVMVNADDPTQKANRLALLAKLQGLFIQIADISQLQ